MQNKELSGHIAAFVTIFIWGLTFISTKVLLQAFTPLEILFIRFIIGYLALWCVCPRILHVTGAKREYYFALAGLLGITLYYLFENIALTFTFASNVGVISSIAPFFTVIFTCIFLKATRPNVRFFIGLIIALGGVFLISFANVSSLKINPKGDILAIIASIIWAGYATVGRKIAEFGYNTIQATRRTFFYGLVFMLPALFWLDFQVTLSDFTNYTMVLNLLFLGLGASAMCFVTWNFAVRTLGAVKTSVYIYIVPVVTAVTSAIVLDERMTWVTVAGITLTLLGLFLSEERW